jgi:hypothetical protein
MPGDVKNGYILGNDNIWHNLNEPNPQYPGPVPPTPQNGMATGAKIAVIAAVVFAAIIVIGVIGAALGVGDETAPNPAATVTEPAPTVTATETEEAPDPEPTEEVGIILMEEAWNGLSSSEQDDLCMLGPEFAGEMFYGQLSKGNTPTFGLTESDAIAFFQENC